MRDWLIIVADYLKLISQIITALAAIATVMKKRKAKGKSPNRHSK
ncbi:hypothetical protein SAMN05660649_04243 [Desulfotomaculum arcticum]|uniref:Uncharacterized protein n=1 Tax=Desulfotruncus arcticus DSM 17038 TaxID=1121424 RepID=A0A1I2Y5C5_9FIRM|nr:hypothetical protein [Desulfotruncus arcticus]SFH20802.1 hypothetical protein SAMN05660649_04243 [Desulfotomaculum arcticum] [Desulfotruncus arcticus DSM 17038]